MNKNIIAILLLDSVSRKYIKTNITELGLMGIIIVNNFNEISDEMLQSTKNVIVLESYFQNVNSYSDVRLFKNLLDISITFIGVDTELLHTLKEYGNTFRADITLLDFEILQAALFQDSALEITADIKNYYNDNVTFAKNVLQNEDVFDTQIQNLAHEFLSNYSEMRKYSNELEKLRVTHYELQDIAAKLSKDHTMLTADYAAMLKNAVTLNKSMREYERIMSQDIYTKIQLHNYPNKPLIIYIKEIEELIHQNSFIETLFEMLRLQGRQSVKVLRLFDGNNCRKVKALPEYYYRVRNQFLVSDITTNDFIAKVGDYTDILDILLTNKTGLDVLIIVDCKSHDDTVISGASMYLNLCRNRDNILSYDLQIDNTIVNGIEEEDAEFLTWGHYTEYNDLMSKEERFLFLSSRPVMQTVFDLYRLVINSI